MSYTVHESFATTSQRGLRHDILPMRLYHKAKKLGIWDPRSIDFTQDILDWQRCTDKEKQTLLQLTSIFQAGEECVTLDLLPLIMAVAQEGHLEEEMFLTTFLWEGVFLISRLVAQDKSLWPFIEQQMNILLVPALGVVTELYEGYENPEQLAFGLNMEEYVNYATIQFSKRIARIERAREQTLEQLYQITETEVVDEE